LGPKDHPGGLDRNTANFGTEFQHYRPPRPNQGPFSSQNKTGGLPLWTLIILGFEKYTWWRLIFHLFGTPFAFISREMGQNRVSGQVLLRFAPFLLQWYFYWNVDDLYKNDTNQVCGWWELREWWWKIGFTPWAIRHVRRNWQFSSSGVAIIPLGTKFKNCQLGRTYSIHISKVPCLGPQLTPSGKSHFTINLHLWRRLSDLSSDLDKTSLNTWIANKTKLLQPFTGFVFWQGQNLYKHLNSKQKCSNRSPVECPSFLHADLCPGSL